jgi:hypothetical protein
MKQKYLAWILFISVELTMFFLFRYYQPLCEPCLHGQLCDPCISSEQIVIFRAGVLISIIFFIWQLISTLQHLFHKGKTLIKQDS